MEKFVYAKDDKREKRY